MSRFVYTAKTKDGETLTDIMEASSRELVGQTLRQQGLLPTSIREKSTGTSPVDLLSNIFGHVSLLERLTFINNLAVTIRAGLPVSKALMVLTKQMPNRYFRKIIEEIAHNVEGGRTLSESMAVYTSIFSPIVVNMVKVGEQSGELDKTLEYLGKQVARDYNLVRRTRSAMMYPAVVGVALVIIGYIMFAFVLPKLTATFKDFNADLPVLTKVIITVVDIFSHYSILVLAGMVGLIFAFLYWRKTRTGRRTLNHFSLLLPVIKILVKKLNLARFTIIFSGLMRSGMPIVEALRITANTMTNIYYQKALLDASEKVKIGVDLVVALEKYPKLFTPMVTQMIQVGEESGTMEKVLEEVANFYEADIDDTMRNLSSIIEPVLVMVIGAVVGLLAVGLILPIYSIGQNI